eukprot:COSAG03_NODE_509_length_7307_cov_21.200333_4_plen_281_part_00
MASLLRTRLGCVGVVRATVFRAAQWQASGRPPVRGLSGSATVVRHLPLAGGRLGAVGLAIGAAVGAGGAVAVVLCDAPAVDEWTEHVDPSSGKTYYYNAKTQATVWEKPAPLLQAQVAVASTPQPVAAAPQPVAAAPQQAAAQPSGQPDGLKHLTFGKRMMHLVVCSMLAGCSSLCCCIPTCLLFFSGYQFWSGLCWGHYVFNAVVVQESDDLYRDPQGVKPVGWFWFWLKETCGAMWFGEWIYFLAKGKGQTLSEMVLGLHFVDAGCVEGTMQQYGYAH